MEIQKSGSENCSPGPILWPPTIRFELHAEMAEEIDLEMCTYGQLSEVQMLRDLDLDLGSGHMAYRHASVIDLYLHTKFH